MLTDKDHIQLKQKGITPSQLEEQIHRFKTGFSKLDVIKPATPNDGIRILSEKESKHYAEILNQKISRQLTISKFVPASGAATRMFKDLYQYLDNPVPIKSLPVEHPIVRFIELLPRFAFFPILADALKVYNLNNVHVRKSKAEEIIHTLLTHETLNYGALPKGLIHFHLYNDAIRTAMEEHLVEGANYATNSDGLVKVHFTVSPEHHELFRNKLYNEGPAIENKYDIGLDISFSFQKPHTDTLAVSPDNEPFRDEKGHLIFRPGGHGALIENLNEQTAEIIFIKNIDNVVPEHLIDKTIEYKKALGGLLLELRDKIFDFLKRMNSDLSQSLIDEVSAFLKAQLFVALPNDILSQEISKQAEYLKQYLNRPIRVCGMVRNEGEPGGGPFWVREKNMQLSLQILESSQLDLNDAHQANQFKAATHFNPVDLVCSTFDYKGNKFDLTKHTDAETGFISEKSLNGRPLKALELPGLWNGAMSDWITLFVEVPIETFNPVKSVNDLLRPQHQPA